MTLEYGNEAWIFRKRCVASSIDEVSEALANTRLNL